MYRRFTNRKFMTFLSLLGLMWMYMVLMALTQGSGISYRATLSLKQGNAISNVNDRVEFSIMKQKDRIYYLDDSADDHFHSDGNLQHTVDNDDGNGAKCRLPTAIIIGVKKAGTRALLEYLKLHPQIRAPGPEPHFFDRYYNRGLEWYRQKMPPTRPGEITIEKTPRYFVTPEVPERVHKMSNDTKLILVVRDPVIRAISDFTQAVSKNMYNANVTFRSKAIRHNGDVNTHWSAVSTGIYIKHLAKWLSYFDVGNIHFVSGEHLIHNSINELNAVQDFLGLERRIDSNMIYFNQTRGFPCIRRSDKTPKCFRRSKGRQHIKTDNDTLSKLYAFYFPYNEHFYKLANRSFKWNPGDVR